MRRVMKIGGSLLLRDNLVTAANQWLDAQTGAQTIVIVGGGNLINAVRELDRLRQVDNQSIHWICVDILTATARFASQWFGWPLIETQAEWNTGLKQGFCIDQPVVVTPSIFYNANTLLSDVSLPVVWIGVVSPSSSNASSIVANCSFMTGVTTPRYSSVSTRLQTGVRLHPT